jgi:hypothetical protein
MTCPTPAIGCAGAAQPTTRMTHRAVGEREHEHAQNQSDLAAGATLDRFATTSSDSAISRLVLRCRVTGCWGLPVPARLCQRQAGGRRRERAASEDSSSPPPSREKPQLGAWLELRAPDPEAALRTVLDAGLLQVHHPGHPYYFMLPGGQVFTIAPAAQP